MELKIYEIAHELKLAFDAIEVDEETGELIGIDRLDEVQMAAAEKLANTGRYIRYAEAQIEAMKAARDDIDARVKRAKKIVDYLKVMTVQGLTALNEKRKIEEPDIRLSTRAVDAVVIDDESKLDDKYFVVKTTKTPSKTEIKNALKAGEEVPGARLVKNYSLQIK